MILWIFFILLGTVVGTLSGLFGIGGGVLMVPAIYLSLKSIGMEDYQALIVGTRTSLAIILFTSLSSTLGHNKRSPLRWDIIKELSLFVVMGTILGSLIVHLISAPVLKGILMGYIFVIAVKMWLGFKPHPGDHAQKPPMILNALVGIIIGLKSAVLGIGGGTISIPYLQWQNVKMAHAAGISAFLGTIIALTGTFTGLLQETSLAISNNQLGDIFLPALFGISSTSLFFARVGAKLSHRVDQQKLRKGFALFLFLITMRNVYSLFVS